MSSAIKNVIIVGAGGHLGPSIVAAFSADSHFTTSILARKSSESTFPSHLKVYRIDDDYPEAGLLEAFQGQDAVISTIATSAAEVQKAMIDAAIKAGVKRFVPSEFGSDMQNEKAVALFPQFFQGKVDTVQYLKTKEKEGLTWSAFTTGPFFEMALPTGYMGYDIKEHKAFLLNQGKDTWSTTRLATVGMAVKNAMLVPEKTANKYLFIDSFTVSHNQVLASLEKVTGKKWEVSYVDAEEQKKLGLEKLARGDFSGAAYLIRYINSVHGYGGNYMEYQESANDFLSLPKPILDDAIAEILTS